MLNKKMLKKDDKKDYLSILFGSTNKNSSLRIKLSLLPWQRSAHRLLLQQALRYFVSVYKLICTLLLIVQPVK